MRTAQQLDPLTPAVYTHGGLVSFIARQDDAAIEQYRKALEIDPNFALAHANLSAVYWYQGRYSESLDEREREAVVLHEPPENQQALRQAYRDGGDKAVTRKLLEMDSNGRYPGYRKLRDIQRAWLYSRLGEKSEALACLEKAFQEREPLLELLAVDRAWDYVRSEPRFQSLIQQMSLPTNPARTLDNH